MLSSSNEFVQGLLCYAVVMGFMFALSDLPEVQVAIGQPLVPALAFGFSAVVGTEVLSKVAAGGILLSIAGVPPCRYTCKSFSNAATCVAGSSVQDVPMMAAAFPFDSAPNGLTCVQTNHPGNLQ
jgi:hypothetical protein